MGLRPRYYRIYYRVPPQYADRPVKDFEPRAQTWRPSLTDGSVDIPLEEWEQRTLVVTAFSDEEAVHRLDYLLDRQGYSTSGRPRCPIYRVYDMVPLEQGLAEVATIRGAVKRVFARYGTHENLTTEELVEKLLEELGNA